MATAPITTKTPPSALAAVAAKASWPWLLAAPLLVVIGAGVAGLSLRSLSLVAANADLFDLASVIEDGAAPEADYLARFAKLGGEADDCNDAVTRARLTVAWTALGAETPDSTLRWDPAMRAARARLVCNPLDGNAWLRYAMIAQRGGAPRERVIDALRASYRTAPSEGWVLEPRLDFASSLIAQGVKEFQAEYVGDLTRFVEFESPGRIAAAYVAAPPAVRALMRAPLDALTTSRRGAILTGIDRLGVDYSREAL